AHRLEPHQGGAAHGARGGGDGAAARRAASRRAGALAAAKDRGEEPQGPEAREGGQGAKSRRTGQTRPAQEEEPRGVRPQLRNTIVLVAVAAGLAGALWWD